MIRMRSRTLRADALAGLPGAIGSVPDGMAASVLAGVSPIHGLYASFAGPIAGGAFAGTQLMVITTTGAAALAAGSAIANIDPSQRSDALLLLTVLAGAFMIVAGVLRLGRYTRFVSHSVMIGFLTGVAANIVFGQIADLAGTTASGPFPLAKAIDVITRPGDISLASVVVGLGAIALLGLLARTPLASFAALVALVIPTVVAALFDAGTVLTVEDGAEIPRGLPLPGIPDLSVFTLNLVTGALAVAAIVLVQGAGVGESAPNPDGSKPSTNRDFFAQGTANVVAGLFKGQPVGGSVGQTALNVTAGARSRWASIFSGIWMLLILVAFSGLVGKVAMPTLAGVLIFAAVGSLRWGEIGTVLQTGRSSQLAVVTTFIATLFLPVAAAVGIGVALSLLLQLNRDALDLKVVRLVPREDGALEERRAPAQLESRAVMLLDAYGSLLYAGSRTLQARLPEIGEAVDPVVILRLRGRTALGATFFVVISDYARRLAKAGGRLYLSGVGGELAEQMRRSGSVDFLEQDQVITATAVLGESSATALAKGETWLLAHPGNDD